MTIYSFSHFFNRLQKPGSFHSIKSKKKKWFTYPKKWLLVYYYYYSFWTHYNYYLKQEMVFHCRCLSFSFEQDEEIEYETRTQTKSTSTGTFYTASSDPNQSVPIFSSHFSILAQKPSNLRVFTIDELKTATKNFCKSSMIGQGGFGSVYKGVIKSLDHPYDEIQIAVKYADGVSQVPKLVSLPFHLLVYIFEFI